MNESLNNIFGFVFAITAFIVYNILAALPFVFAYWLLSKLFH